MFKNIGLAARSIQGWIWLVMTAVPTVWVFIAGTLERMLWSVRIMDVTLTLAASSAFAFCTLRCYELVTGWYGARKEGLRLAAELEDMNSVGHNRLRLGDVAIIWAGEDSSAIRKNICLRRLKHAAELGLFEYFNPVEGKPTQESRANATALAKFFRERQWLNLPPMQPHNPKRVKRTRSAWTNNWIRRW